MQLVVNGKPLDHSGPGALDDVLAQIGATSAHVAVMVNETIVNRAAFGATQLREGDRVDVLTLARGG